MEKGGSGFDVSDKKSSLNSGFVSSIKLQNSGEVFPSKISVTGPGNNLDRPFVGGDDDDDVRGGGGNDVVSNIHCYDVSSSDGGGGSGGYFAKGANSQAFDILPSSYSTISYKPPAREMGLQFTAGQWNELERQALIYNCMISSVPLPPHLLFPLSTNFSATPPLHSSAPSIYSGKYSRNGDLEPGRCKRTDGKKWRCARQVAPHQKYCERHLQRSRPRSRKPVEAKINGETNKKARRQQTESLLTLQSNSASSQHLVATKEHLLFLNAKTDLSISTPYYKAINRDLGLTTEGKIVSSEPPWEIMMEANIGLGNCYFPQKYELQQPPLNLFSYPNFPATEIDLPSRFIDAWSINNLNRNNGNIDTSISLNDSDLSPSLNLSMAMAAGNIVDLEMRNIQTKDNVTDCDDHETKDSIWLNPVCWEAVAHGGPLGEALQPVGVSNPSTPSGVLQWTMFSHSDSSACNSPTMVAPPSEVANQ